MPRVCLLGHYSKAHWADNKWSSQDQWVEFSHQITSSLFFHLRLGKVPIVETDMWHHIKGQSKMHMHTHTHTYIFARTHTYTHPYMHARTYNYIHAHTPPCLHTHLTQYKQRALAWEGINSGKSQVARTLGSCATSVWERFEFYTSLEVESSCETQKSTSETCWMGVPACYHLKPSSLPKRNTGTPHKRQTLKLQFCFLSWFC